MPIKTERLDEWRNGMKRAVGFVALSIGTVGAGYAVVAWRSNRVYRRLFSDYCKGNVCDLFPRLDDPKRLESLGVPAVENVTYYAKFLRAEGLGWDKKSADELRLEIREDALHRHAGAFFNVTDDAHTPSRFDTVLCLQGLSAMPADDAKAQLLQAARWLKPGGHVVIRDLGASVVLPALVSDASMLHPLATWAKEVPDTSVVVHARRGFGFTHDIVLRRNGDGPTTPGTNADTPPAAEA